MKYKDFNIEKSKEIINQTLEGKNFETLDHIPSIDEDDSKFTYNNGFYVNCVSFFIDIRNSTQLTSKIHPHTLSKYYRAYIGQIISILRSHKTCKSINIVGDCVSAIFSSKDLTYKDPRDVIEALEAASMSHAMIDLLNTKFHNKTDNFEDINVGIGINSGKTLIIKAGEKNSGIHKLIFLGNCVNIASHLCDKANYNNVIVSEDIYNKCGNYICNDERNYTFKGFLNPSQEIDNIQTYKGNFYRTSIEDEAIKENNK